MAERWILRTGIDQRRDAEIFTLALEQMEQSLRTNADNLKALALKAALLRRMGRTEDAQELIQRDSGPRSALTCA